MALAFDPGRGEVMGEPAPVRRSVTMDSLFGHAQVAFSTGGSVAYVPGGDRAIGRLARVDRQGRVEVLPAGPERYGALDLSPDGTRLAVHVADVNDYVWIWDLRRNEGRRITGPSPAGWPIQTLPVAGREPPRTLLQGAGVFPNSWAETKIAIGELLRGRWRTGALSSVGPASVEWDETYLYVVKSAAPDERRKLHLGPGWLDELRKLAPPAALDHLDAGIVRRVRTC